MKTHERNVLMWTVSRPTRMAILTVVILLLVAWFSTGCTPTSATSIPTHPNELRMIQYTQCFAEYWHLGELQVVFKDDLGLTPCSYDQDIWGPKDGRCPSAGRATYGKNGVSYWGPWVRGETVEYGNPSEKYMRAVAAHEVGHVACGNSEKAANECAAVAMAEVCE